MERRVDFGDGSAGTVSLNEPVLRYGNNPILTAHQVNAVWTEPHLRVMTVHNAGVAVVGSETVMLFRSHLRCGISVIGLARSNDGIADWRVHPRPFLQPATANDQLAPGLDPAEIAEHGGRRGRGRPDQPGGRDLRHHVQRILRRGTKPGARAARCHATTSRW